MATKNTRALMSDSITISDEQKTLLQKNILKELHHFASNQYYIIAKSIRDFESSLDDNHEVALKLTSFGQSVTLAVTNIGYHNPDIIIFYGYTNGEKATLIQHISQLSFLMVAAKKANPKNPPNRIGFIVDQDEE